MDKIVTHNVSLSITNICTLKCKLCSAGIPYYKKLGHVDFDEIRKDLSILFKVYDYIEKFDISGGEPLTHPDIIKILKEVIEYKNQIGNIRIITNGTIELEQKLIDIMKKEDKFTLILDDYGTISKNKEKIVEACQINNINTKVNVYHGDNQWCGGWIDCGDIFQINNCTENETINKFKNCNLGQYMCLTLKHGKLYQCVRAMLANELNLLEENNFDYVDLYDENDIASKKEIVKKFGMNPISTCKRCNGFDVKKSKRVSAAEQI